MRNFQKMMRYALPFSFQVVLSVIRYILSYGGINAYRRMYQRHKIIEKLLNVLHKGAFCSEAETENHVRNSYGRHGTGN